MTKWLDIARKYEGTAEMPGPGSNPVILGWIHAHGRPDARDDSAIAWCGFGMAGIFTEAGHADVVPREPGVAGNWRNAGEALSTPKVGAIVVMPRHDTHNPHAAHVGLIANFDEHHILVLGCNQGDKVGVDAFERRDRVYTYRWPIATRTPAELAARNATGDPVSRIAAAAQRQKRDATRATGAGGTIPVVPNPPPKGSFQTLLDKAGAFKGSTETLIDFTTFAWGRWPWVAGAVVLYFLLRTFWDGHQIAGWRTADHNEGYTT